MSKQPSTYTTLTAWIILVAAVVTTIILIWSIPHENQQGDSTLEELPLEGDGIE